MVDGLHRAQWLTIEGRILDWTLQLFVLLLQWFFVQALTRFVMTGYLTAQLVQRLERHPLHIAYREVPKETLPLGVFPRRPRLHQLADMATRVMGARELLQKELTSRPTPRWYQSQTWALLAAHLATIDPMELTAKVRPGKAAQLETTFCASAAIFVLREVMSGLTLTVFQLGPALALLAALQFTFVSDQSHRLLGLIWADAVLAIGGIMSTFIWIERNRLLSDVRSDKDPTEWNWNFIQKIVVYVLVPVAILFATQFPEIGAWLWRFIEPVQHIT